VLPQQAVEPQLEAQAQLAEMHWAPEEDPAARKLRILAAQRRAGSPEEALAELAVEPAAPRCTGAEAVLAGAAVRRR
jgi:hypothetical protein